MKFKFRILFLFISFGISKCGPPLESSTGASTENNFDLKSTLLASNNDPAHGFAGYAYVLFNEKPNEISLVRGRSIAKSFLNNFPLVFPHERISKKTVVNYWLLTHLIDSVDYSNNADYIYNSYDYQRGLKMINLIGKANSKGPLLVAFKTPFNSKTSKRDAIVFDLSNIPDEEIDRAFKIWKAQLCDGLESEGGNWTFIFNKLREQVRFLFNSYGQELVTIIN